MARKKLLSESEIRQFMKLANIKPLQEMGGYMPGMRDEEEDEPGMRDTMMEEEGDEEEPAPEMPAPESDDEDLGVELDDEGEGEEEIVAEVARRVAARLIREKKQDAVATKLAERIFRRLASK